MYEVKRNGKTILESDACGIGFVVSRRGVRDRELVEAALDFSSRFDHRGAPGHGAGMLLDIPWGLLPDLFPSYRGELSPEKVALGTFFLPYDADSRRRCIDLMIETSALAGVEIAHFTDVVVDLGVLPQASKALRVAPVVKQALFVKPEDFTEGEWFACRYLLRLAFDEAIGPLVGDEFSVVSLSNRTVVYKGLVELSKLADFYPVLKNPKFKSRFAVFHSRYSTNTSTAWRRAQPFWGLAHNGEVNTIKGNTAWMEAIGRDLVSMITERYPRLESLSKRVVSVVCSGGSDTANLDDMMIALLAGGMTLPQSLLALLPEATSALPSEKKLHDFYRATNVFLGACDGPAAIVACDGDEAVAHLDRNGLRPLWVTTTEDYAVAASELTGSFPTGRIERQRILGPGETVSVKLDTGEVLWNADVQAEVSQYLVEGLGDRKVEGGEAETLAYEGDLCRARAAFGMTKEDMEVILLPMAEKGAPPVGSMGDDTPPAAMLDALPRRIEDHFALRFAQETSPPIDPMRDAWVFDPSVAVGDRSGIWGGGTGPVYTFPTRVLSLSQLAWLKGQDGVVEVSLCFPASEGAEGLEKRLEDLVWEAVEKAEGASVLVLTDEAVSKEFAAVPGLRAVGRLHKALVDLGKRHKVGLVVNAGIWDVHHVSLLVAMGTDAVCPWLGCRSAAGNEAGYLKGLRSGFTEAMSMMGVTPSSAYCGARLVEAVALDQELLASEFEGVPGHLGGIGREVLDKEWLMFHSYAFAEAGGDLVDAGEFRHSREGRPHFHNAHTIRALHSASGYARKIHEHKPGSWEAYKSYSELVSGRDPVTILDCIDLRPGEPVPIEEVEPEEAILWRFMAAGMSEGALSEPAHRTVAAGMNLLKRYCRIKAKQGGFDLPPGMGPFANSGEGGFDRNRVGKRDWNRSVQYAGGRFTITPMTAACAEEAEVKFAQGAKPGKGGQLPGKKVTGLVAERRGCEPGYELVSPPINHNLYSIEDVKLMIEGWRHLNPKVNCALKYVATYGIEMVVMGGVNAGANRLHLSDGCGGTGAAKRVDQKHAGVPVAAVLPRVQDMLVEEGLRHLVEISADGGVQNGGQALKLMLLGADKVAFGTSLLVAIGCSMLRKCHLAGPDPADPKGLRRLGCTPGIATQDPAHVSRFAGKPQHIARYLRFIAREIRETMAAHGIRTVSEAVGRRDLLERKPGLGGKAAHLRLEALLNPPHGFAQGRDYALQTKMHMPDLREREASGAERALAGEAVTLLDHVTNADRCVGMRAAGVIARAAGDEGLKSGSVTLHHEGAAGHFYGAYLVPGMTCRLMGLCADSAFTASYGGKLIITPGNTAPGATIVGNAFGYGARGGAAYIAGRAGNRFGICLRKNEKGGPRIVVEGVEANAFQYMTGGTALVLGSTGPHVGSGMTGGTIYLLDADVSKLNPVYAAAHPLDEDDELTVATMLSEHVSETGSPLAASLLEEYDLSRFTKVKTKLVAEDWQS